MDLSPKEVARPLRAVHRSGTLDCTAWHYLWGPSQSVPKTPSRSVPKLSKRQSDHAEKGSNECNKGRSEVKADAESPSVNSQIRSKISTGRLTNEPPDQRYHPKNECSDACPAPGAGFRIPCRFYHNAVSLWHLRPRFKKLVLNAACLANLPPPGALTGGRPACAGTPSDDAHEMKEANNAEYRKGSNDEYPDLDPSRHDVIS
jgi:hypothetical protein